MPFIEVATMSQEKQDQLTMRKLRQTQIGAGANVFRGSKDGVWLGAKTFADAPFKVSMAGALTASSAIITGTIQTATSGARVLISGSNDITLYDDSTGGGGKVTGNSAEFSFLRTDDETKGFIFRKRAGKDFDTDNVLECFANPPATGRFNSWFNGRTGNFNSINLGYYGVTLLNDRNKVISALNGRFDIDIYQMGEGETTPTAPNLPSLIIYNNQVAGSSGNNAYLIGTNSGQAGLGYEYEYPLGDSTTQFDITNPSGNTFRYTYDGTGTNPGISTTTLAPGVRIMLNAQNFSAGNNGTFEIVVVGTNYFEIFNDNGVVESNKTIGTGLISRYVLWTNLYTTAYNTVISGANLQPETHNTYKLGQNSVYWKEGYITDLYVTNLHGGDPTVISLTSGMTLTSGKAVFIANTETDFEGIIQSLDDATYNFGKATGNYEKVAQEITGSDFNTTNGRSRWTNRVALKLLKVGSPTDNVKISIQGDSGGDPSGVDLSSATIAGTTLTTSSVEYNIDLSYLDLGTGTYYIVVERTGAGDDTNYYAVRIQGGSNPYAGGSLHNKAVGSGWLGENKDMYFNLKQHFIDGRIYLASAIANGGYTTFCGFTTESVSGGAAVNIRTSGNATGVSGVTIGAPNYLSDTFGAVSASAGTNSKKVGLGLTTTSLTILNTI